MLIDVFEPFPIISDGQVRKKLEKRQVVLECRERTDAAQATEPLELAKILRKFPKN